MDKKLFNETLTREIAKVVKESDIDLTPELQKVFMCQALNANIIYDEGHYTPESIISSSCEIIRMVFTELKERKEGNNE